MTNINLFDYVNPFIYYTSKFLEDNFDNKKKEEKDITIKNIKLIQVNEKSITLDCKKQEDSYKLSIFRKNTISNENIKYTVNRYLSISNNEFYNYILFNNECSIQDRNKIKLRVDSNVLCFYNLFHQDKYCVNILQYESINENIYDIERILKSHGFEIITNNEFDKSTEKQQKEQQEELLSEIPTSLAPSGIEKPSSTSTKSDVTVIKPSLNIPFGVIVLAFKYKEDKENKHKKKVEKFYKEFTDLLSKLKINLKEEIKVIMEAEIDKLEKIITKSTNDDLKKKKEKDKELLDKEIVKLNGGSLNYNLFLTKNKIKKIMMKGGFIVSNLIYTNKLHIYNYINYEVINQISNSGGNIGYYKYDPSSRYHKLYNPISKKYSNTSILNLKVINKKITDEMKTNINKSFSDDIYNSYKSSETFYILLDNDYNKLEKNIKYVLIFNSDAILKPSKNSKLLFGILYTNDKSKIKEKKTNNIYKYNYCDNINDLDYLFYLSPIGVPYLNFINNNNDLLPIVPFLLDPKLLNDLNYAFYKLYMKDDNKNIFIENFNQFNNGYSKDKLSDFNIHINKNDDDFDYSKYLLNDNDDKKHKEDFFKINPKLFEEKLLFNKNLNMLNKSINDKIAKKYNSDMWEKLLKSDLFIELANLDDKLFLDDEFTVIDLNNLLNIKVDHDELEEKALKDKNTKILLFINLCPELFNKSIFHFINRNIDFIPIFNLGYSIGFSSFTEESTLKSIYEFIREYKNDELDFENLHPKLYDKLLEVISNDILEPTNKKYQDILETEIINEQKEKDKKEKSLLEKISEKTKSPILTPFSR